MSTQDVSVGVPPWRDGEEELDLLLLRNASRFLLINLPQLYSSSFFFHLIFPTSFISLFRCYFWSRQQPGSTTFWMRSTLTKKTQMVAHLIQKAMLFLTTTSLCPSNPCIGVLGFSFNFTFFVHANCLFLFLFISQTEPKIWFYG